MIKKTVKEMIEQSKSSGWLLEPDAKALLKSKNLDIPDCILTNSFEKAENFLKKSKRPVVAKAVSKSILHKTEYNAVVTNISSSKLLKTEMTRLDKLEGCESILIEEMVQGIEIIVGAKNDLAFGPVIVFGIGGTSVEIYNDTAIRLAPLKPSDIPSMVESLKAKKIIYGYRGRPGVNIKVLTDMLINFSNFVMEIENAFQSIDLNPVICTKDRCIIADARIILKTQ
jgi:acetate---CoA ligase (ADP-forming) subunit beta